MTFQKILIANRGEIACRVAATARRMGIKTVAVYSDADARAKHVAMADEAVRIGAAPIGDSYLRAEAIVQAARDTGAEAIHPGYGFLSENPDFVEAVEAAGLTFIGPPADAIRRMGLKDAAKAVMQEAGVPVVPGYHGGATDPATLAAEADQIGYPVLIKARAGGGGKGMRLVPNAGEFAAALASAEREAEASFGDPLCLIEKYITQPRHVEIQIFADDHGNVVHLFERDCSLQRRHQKVIEEAPAPDMPEAVREAMGAAAIAAARAIGYVGAGTVEFIADGSDGLKQDGFWFMEMNTRLQVEHPVTEAITGLDLVALQIQIAGGGALPFSQEDLKIDGHAFEARIYAEDPTRDFLPAIGKIRHLAFPDGVSFAPAPVRVDAGVRQGDAVTPYYDPMIAKLVVHAASRPQALAQLRDALKATEVAGLTTNTAFLLALAEDEDFAAGRVDTGLIGRRPDLTELPDASAPVLSLAVLAALGLHVAPKRNTPWTALRGWQAWGSASRVVPLLHKGTLLQISVRMSHQALWVDDRPVSLAPIDDHTVEIMDAGVRQRLRLHVEDREITIFEHGISFRFEQPDPLAVTDAGTAAEDIVYAPMPGKIVAVEAGVGSNVSAGDALVTLEAMKMEHTLAAPRDGTIASISISLGDQVQDGAVLLQLEPADG